MNPRSDYAIGTLFGTICGTLFGTIPTTFFGIVPQENQWSILTH